MTNNQIIAELTRIWHSPHLDLSLKGSLGEVIEALKVSEMPTGWIPVTYHEITDAEREENGYPKDWVLHMDCNMPCDCERILVQTRWGIIELDEHNDDGELYLDSGYDWAGDIIAWMPLPEPYKGGEDE